MVMFSKSGNLFDNPHQNCEGISRIFIDLVLFRQQNDLVRWSAMDYTIYIVCIWVYKGGGQRFYVSYICNTVNVITFIKASQIYNFYAVPVTVATTAGWKYLQNHSKCCHIFCVIIF